MAKDCKYLGDADGVSDERWGTRAVSAYFRVGGEYQDQPSTPDAYEYEGRHYVVLANSAGILAMYRVKNDGTLRRLRRFPACIVKAVEG